MLERDLGSAIAAFERVLTYKAFLVQKLYTRSYSVVQGMLVKLKLQVTRRSSNLSLFKHFWHRVFGLALDRPLRPESRLIIAAGGEIIHM